MNDDHPQSLAKSPNQRLRVAVIGAGISGLMCARTLHDHGIAVKVFEKSRGAGGRMATRRTADQLTFDHGAQYFTVRDARFETHVKSWVQDGIVAHWHARIGTLTAGRLHWSDRLAPRRSPDPDGVARKFSRKCLCRPPRQPCGRHTRRR